MSFLSSVNQTTVVKFYSTVMDDVLAGVREAFLDEGVDEQVLQELRHSWESKVLASKALDPPEVVEPQPPPLQVPQVQNETNKIHQQTNGTQPVQSTSAPKNKPSTSMNTQQNVVKQQFTPAPSHQTNLTNTATTDLNNKMVPISLTLPPPAGSQNTQPRVYSLQVPASALQSDQLQRILTAPVISATMALPESVASNLLQQHVTAALQGQASVIPTATNNTGNNVLQLGGAQNLLLPENSNRQFSHMNQISGNISQIDGTCDVSDDEIEPSTNPSLLIEEPVNFSITVLDKIHQVDGIYDTSDDDDEDDDDDDDDIDDDDDDDDDDNKEDEENEEAENGVEDDPLNSGDDVSEGDNTDLFDTDNVVVCQYDKINRSRNKWKFYLKDGIMNLSGRDYIFQKANGDAEW